MNESATGLSPHYSEPTHLGPKVSITGKWIPGKQNGLFRQAHESKEMRKEWLDIHEAAKRHDGILSTEINHTVGEDALLIHHEFSDGHGLADYFSTIRPDISGSLTTTARPQTHLVRGAHISDEVREALGSKNVPASFGNFLFGYVKDGGRIPQENTAIRVTAKWTCREASVSQLEDLITWWHRVGTDAYSMENGLLKYEAYQVLDEHALIIHEVFENSDELKFHLSKGTAEIYKKDIDKVAVPECYYFRGPVSWTIRTYSKFLRLPATYSILGTRFTR